MIIYYDLNENFGMLSLEDNNQQCALIGTLGYKLTSDGEYKEAKHTTPQAPELQHTFKTILDNDIKNSVENYLSKIKEKGNEILSEKFEGVFTEFEELPNLMAEAVFDAAKKQDPTTFDYEILK